MNDKDLYYTAGIIDGEGTITLTRLSKKQHKSPIVSCSSTTIEILEYLKEIYGGFISKHKVYKEHHLQSWSWKLGSNKAIELLELIQPLLKEPKKSKRARFILDKYKSCTPRNGKYSNELKQLKEKFEEEFFLL